MGLTKLAGPEAMAGLTPTEPGLGQAAFGPIPHLGR